MAGIDVILSLSLSLSNLLFVHGLRRPFEQGPDMVLCDGYLQYHSSIAYDIEENSNVILVCLVVVSDFVMLLQSICLSLSST